MLLMMDLGATVCFAYTGALIALNQKASYIGVVLSAMLTAMGGGTVRDVLLRNDYIFWIENEQYLIAVMAALLLAVLFKHKVILQNRVLVIVDSLSTAVFILVGIFAAQSNNCGIVTIVLMGMLTGIGGSVLRQVIVENHSTLLFDQISTLSVAVGSALAIGMVLIEVNMIVIVVSIGAHLFFCKYYFGIKVKSAYGEVFSDKRLIRIDSQAKYTRANSSSLTSKAAHCRKAKQSRFYSEK